MKQINEKVIKTILERIESNLEYVNITELIELSGFSYFHFHRIFHAYVGETLKQYLKRIRLEKSAYELQYKKVPITQVALNAGFSTPSSFNKAFKEFFNTTPSKYKKMTIRKEEFTMIKPIKTVDLESIEVYSVRHVGAYTEIGKAFEKLMKWAYTNKIKNKKNLMGKGHYSYGISYDDPNVTEFSKLRSDACIDASDEVTQEEGINKQTISGGRYAVFLHKGAYTNLKETYNDIFSSYVRQNDVQLRNVPVFERYLNRDPRRTKEENLKTEIYIPIV